MKTFWLVKYASGDVKINFSEFTQENVKSFMKINQYLKLENPNWELHKINDDNKEKIIAHYEINTTETLNYYDE